MVQIMIRQPGYIPYLGFFKKIQISDIFVYLDDVQFSINGEDNRNRIRTENGSKWLTVPVRKPFGKKLCDVEICNETNWNEDHKNILKEEYHKAPFFDIYWNEIESILDQKWIKLIDLNLEFINYFKTKLGIKNKTIRSSELDLNTTQSQLLFDICKKLCADTYISGALGKNYLDESLFNKNGIHLLYENFQHPKYNQIHSDFIPFMSIVDLLFNEGENSKQIIYNSKNL